MLLIELGYLKSRINGFKRNIMFGLKCLFRKNPIHLLMFVFLSNMCIFAIGLRICEYQASILDDNKSFNFYINTFWFVAVTMTTVGYGEYHPKTIPGRIFSFLICIWGIFFISLGFVSLINILKFSYKEKTAIGVIKKLRSFNGYKNISAKIITNLFRLKIAEKKLARNNSLRNRYNTALYSTILKKQLYEFRKIKIEIKNLKDEVDFLQYLVDNVDNVKSIMADINDFQQSILVKIIGIKEKALHYN